MSHELFYTSVPQGLKPGSKGFCTVAMTAQMPTALAERLESLSGYRAIYAPGTPDANKNPIVWAHWRVIQQGRPRSVLSRVSFAGFDYSQRTNKFAHHIVLEPSEMAAAGPAWMLMQPGFMETKWDGAPRLLPEGRTVPGGSSSVKICKAWETIAGDAGWGGVLAESFQQSPTLPAYIIYPAGTDLLPLLEESLALLSPSQRWDVTFNTYFTDLPVGLSCAWRGVLAGTPQAKDVANLGSRALVIDLSKSPNRAPDSLLVQAARTGELPLAAAAVKAEVDIFELENASPVTRSKQTGKQKLQVKGSYELADKPPLSEDNLEPQVPSRRPPMQQVPGRHGVPVWVIPVAVASSLVVGLAIGYVLGKGQSVVSVPPVVATPPEQSRPAPVSSGKPAAANPVAPSEPLKSSERIKAKDDSEQAKPSEAKASTQPVPESSSTAHAAAAPATANVNTTAKPAEEKKPAIISLPNELPLPEVLGLGKSGKIVLEKVGKFAKNSPVSSMRLDFFGSDSCIVNDITYVQDSSNDAELIIVAKQRKGISEQKDNIAKIRLDSGDLTFEWMGLSQASALPRTAIPLLLMQQSQLEITTSDGNACTIAWPKQKSNVYDLLLSDKLPDQVIALRPLAIELLKTKVANTSPNWKHLPASGSAFEFEGSSGDTKSRLKIVVSLNREGIFSTNAFLDDVDAITAISRIREKDPAQSSARREKLIRVRDSLLKVTQMLNAIAIENNQKDAWILEKDQLEGDRNTFKQKVEEVKKYYDEKKDKEKKFKEFRENIEKEMKTIHAEKGNDNRLFETSINFDPAKMPDGLDKLPVVYPPRDLYELVNKKLNVSIKQIDTSDKLNSLLSEFNADIEYFAAFPDKPESTNIPVVKLHIKSWK